MTALGEDYTYDGTEQREGVRKIDQSWLAIDGSHAGTAMGRNVDMTRRGVEG